MWRAISTQPNSITPPTECCHQDNRGVQVCVCVLLCLFDLFACRSLRQPLSCRHTDNPKQTPLQREDVVDRDHYGDECCLKLELPLSCSPQARQKIRCEAREITVQLLLSFSAEEAEIETKKCCEAKKFSLCLSQQAAKMGVVLSNERSCYMASGL